MVTTPVTNDLEHVDVLIVGAGISGIAAAYSLSTQHPDKTFAILEARGARSGVRHADPIDFAVESEGCSVVVLVRHR
jgi:cation diffusion facilitator CzcD-associated flavoprotein CzcO